MSLFDVFTNGALTQILDQISTQGRGAMDRIQRTTPAGMGGLLGAGALGAILGNFSGDIMKNVALAGAGAVAWNFFQKWKGQAQEEKEQPYNAGQAQVQRVSSQTVDPTTKLVIMAMIFAARADGSIDAAERQRIDTILQNMFPQQDTQVLVRQMSDATLDPQKVAMLVSSPEQAEDVLRLSCAVIDIDNYMERSYIDGLAKALRITPQREREIENEASQAKRQLMASMR